MNRLKAIYRSWAIPCAGQQVYSPRHRAAWLEKLRSVTRWFAHLDAKHRSFGQVGNVISLLRLAKIPSNAKVKDEILNREEEVPESRFYSLRASGTRRPKVIKEELSKDSEQEAISLVGQPYSLPSLGCSAKDLPVIRVHEV